GHTPESPLSSAQAAAVAFAEQAIEARTRLTWGSTRSETITVRLNAANYYLRVPRDVVSVEDVSPAIGATELFQLSRYGVELFDAAYDQIAWAAGTYRVEVTRGIVEIPAAVNRAAALLAAHYLGLADPERSRYDGMSLGDFSGTERRDAFPVPAAEQLLRPWITSVAVAS
ncbi:MAG TPA: hypothetical protein VF202_04435, partial [Trueperaceae bacterium]